MTSPAPCLRHPQSVWMAGCLDCRAWHLHRTRILVHPPSTGRTAERPARTAG
jgi:hypothetical protein